MAIVIHTGFQVTEFVLLCSCIHYHYSTSSQEMSLMSVNFTPKHLTWPSSFSCEIFKLSYTLWIEEKINFKCVLCLFSSQTFHFWRCIYIVIRGSHLELWKTIRITAWDTAVLLIPLICAELLPPCLYHPLKRKLFSPPVSEDSFFVSIIYYIFSSIFCVPMFFIFSFRRLPSIKDIVSLRKNWWF